jgi:hypothetical protein
MIRPSVVVWLVVAGSLGFGMFQVKREVQDLEDQLTRINRGIASDRDAIHVLKAEWSYLTQPTRLADVSKRHLTLAPVATAQLGQIENIPLKQQPPQQPAIAAIPARPGAPTVAAAATTAAASASPAAAAPVALPVALKVTQGGAKLASARTTRVN